MRKPIYWKTPYVEQYEITTSCIKSLASPFWSWDPFLTYFQLGSVTTSSSSSSQPTKILLIYRRKRSFKFLRRFKDPHRVYWGVEPPYTWRVSRWVTQGIVFKKRCHWWKMGKIAAQEYQCLGIWFCVVGYCTLWLYSSCPVTWISKIGKRSRSNRGLHPQ